MISLQNGYIRYNDIYEMIYDLLVQELELEVLPDGKLFNPENQNIFQYNGQNIIVTIKENDIKYAGQGDIVFNPLEDIRLVTALFGFYLTKKQEQGMPFISYFNNDIIDPSTDIKYEALTVKFDTLNSITSNHYHNKCLKFIDIIFMMENDPVDLSNFDIIEDGNDNSNKRSRKNSRKRY